MLSLSCLLMTVCLAAVIAAPSSDQLNTENKRDNEFDMCFTSEGVYRHGELVSTHRSPCLKYRCQNGRLKVFESACPYDGKCHPVGSVWDGNDCHTYTCHKMDYNSYRIDRLQSGCKDAYGRCRRPGDMFPYSVSGHIYRGCFCTTSPERIKYHCNYPGTRPRRELTREVQL